MDNWAWILAGGAAATGFVTMAWGYIRSLWQQIASRIIVSSDVRGWLPEAITQYVWQEFQVSPFGRRTYLGQRMFVRPTKRVQMVAMETVGTEGKLYWKGWRPLWLSRLTNEPKTNLKAGDNEYVGGLRLTFFRGMFNLDRLIVAATKQFNHTRAATGAFNQHRYAIHHIFGTAGKPARLQGDSGSCCETTSQTNWDPTTLLEHRLLQWKFDDLGTSRMNHGNALNQLALDENAENLIADVKRWRNGEDWFKGRGIPWRRSCLLHGQPGTGKTSLVRAIGEDFDLPIFVFHLATLFNDEFHAHWQKMLCEVPCIALIEDLDAVFHGRENVAGGHLTFDCLLNCLDGVERSDGVFLVVTTNHAKTLDSALTRPGRSDRILELTNPNEVGRFKLCKRILVEWPETWDETVVAGANDTGAQFQDRCTQRALQKYWKTDESTA